MEVLGSVKRLRLKEKGPWSRAQARELRGHWAFCPLSGGLGRSRSGGGRAAPPREDEWGLVTPRTAVARQLWALREDGTLVELVDVLGVTLACVARGLQQWLFLLKVAVVVPRPAVRGQRLTESS